MCPKNKMNEGTKEVGDEKRTIFMNKSRLLFFVT